MVVNSNPNNISHNNNMNNNNSNNNNNNNTNNNYINTPNTSLSNIESFFNRFSSLEELQFNLESSSFIKLDKFDINSLVSYKILNTFSHNFYKHYINIQNSISLSREPLLYNFIRCVPADLVVGVVFSHFNSSFVKGVKTELLNFNLNVGNSLIMLYFYKSMINEIKFNGVDEAFNMFKSKFNIDDSSAFDLGYLILSYFRVSTGLIKTKVDFKNTASRDKISYYYLTSYGLNFLTSHNFLLGLKLPLVVKPNLWDLNSSKKGGYLTDNLLSLTDLIHPSVDNVEKSSITNDLMYSQINYQNSVPFIINQKFYDFIINNGFRLKLLMEDITSIETVSDELKSLYLQQSYILTLSKLYLNFPFYFPMFFDWRGRLYSETSYLTYQGSELSKAMLLFKNGGLISQPEHFEVLLAYGASLYGLGKSSFIERVNWSTTNFDKIVEMDENFLLSADQPFLFIAWCLEIQTYKDNLLSKTPFISHFPIQWDATCNGLQHLALLCNDYKLAESVNIVKSDKNVKPSDIYSIILDFVINEIQNFTLIDPELYTNLSKFPLSRKLIKKSVMTIPYSVTIIGIKEQLIENFKVIKIPVSSNKYNYRYEYHVNNQSFQLTSKELFILAKLIHSSIFKLHPKLKIFLKYWYNVSDYLNEYNRGLKWSVPNGLVVNQKYVHFDKITIFYKLFFKKRKQVTIRKATNRINSRKQKSGILPNLIHSLDASVLTLLTNKLLKTNGPLTPFYSVHDCFASTANYMPTLKNLYQESLIDIYGENKFLNKIQSEINGYIDSLPENSNLEKPDLNDLIKPRLNKKIMKNLKESFNIII